MEPIKIIIVDDHKIIRDGIIAILKSNPSMNVVGSIASGDELLELMKRQAADIIVLDLHLHLKNGIDVARKVKVEYPDVKILINTMSEQPEEIDAALTAGVNGYILKTFGSEELVKAIQMVSYGNNYYSLPVIKAYIKNMNKYEPMDKRLTPFETKIMKMIYGIYRLQCR